MFDNIAFSVVIGLVFIYLLYSLLTTIVGEIISGWLQIRSGMLRTAIERMLNDGYYKDVLKETGIKPPNFLQRYFLMKEHPAFKSSTAGKFYEYPSIKYLSRTEAEKKTVVPHTRPSYISADNFALTVMNMLSEKGLGKDKMEQIVFALRVNSLHIQPETLKNISVILDNASGDFEAFKKGLMKWFDETMDRTTGWYKTRFSRILFWLGFIIAFTYNVDSIRIARILANDKDARGQLVNMGIALAKDSSRYKEFLTTPADSIKPKSVLDTGYSRITTDISNASLILGLGWSLDTLTYYDDTTISITGDTLRFNSIRADAVAYADSLKIRDTLLAHMNRRKLDLDALQQTLSIQQVILKNRLASPAKVKDTAVVSATIAKLEDSLAKTLQGQFDDSFRLVLLRPQVLHYRSRLDTAIGTGFSQIQYINDTLNNKTSVLFGGRVPFDNWHKIWYFIKHITPFKASFWGILITALMLSLGAPFWFGVLNKLVSLRSAGVKPEEKKPTPHLTGSDDKLPPTPAGIIVAQAANQPKPTPVNSSERIWEAFSDVIQHEQGLVAIALKYKQPNPAIPPQENPPFISIGVKSQEIANYLAAKYGSFFTLGDQGTLSLKYAIDTPNATHSTQAGGNIANKGTQNLIAPASFNSGTLGGYLTRNGSDKLYIMSCWHVMKDNNDLTDAIKERNILGLPAANAANAVNATPGAVPPPSIAIVEEGFFSDTAGIDIGIAVCSDTEITPNPGFVIKTQHRPVDAFDSLSNCKVTILGAVSGLQQGTIFDYKVNAQITYPGQNQYLVKDVFSITQKDPATGLSRAPTLPGDSGSVVIDGDGKPLGMIIGGNGTCSYAIKFTNIFSNGIHSLSQYSFKV